MTKCTHYGTTPAVGGLEAMAEIVHNARWPADRQMAITPFADEDRNGREYCFRIARAVLSAQPQYLANCFRGGECHGKCESTVCTNYGKMIVARRCVEDIPPGTVMPKETM